jgi:hypothetical protein
VITSSLAEFAVHPLLNYYPVSIIRYDESVEIEVKPILDRRAVDLGDQTTGFRERSAVKAYLISNRDQFVRGPARVVAAPPANVDAQLPGQRLKASLERTDDRCGDAGGMPVHSHDRAKRLEPEGVRQPAEQLLPAIFEYDRLCDDSAQPCHAIAEPFGHATTVKWQVGAARSPWHLTAPSAVKSISDEGLQALSDLARNG